MAGYATIGFVFVRLLYQVSVQVFAWPTIDRSRYGSASDASSHFHARPGAVARHGPVALASQAAAGRHASADASKEPQTRDGHRRVDAARASPTVGRKSRRRGTDR